MTVARHVLRDRRHPPRSIPWPRVTIPLVKPLPPVAAKRLSAGRILVMPNRLPVVHKERSLLAPSHRDRGRSAIQVAGDENRLGCVGVAH